MQDRLGPVDVLDEALDAAEKGKILVLAATLVMQANLHAIVQERELTQALGNDLVVKLDLTEDLFIGHEVKFGAAFLGTADHPQRRNLDAALDLGQSIDHDTPMELDEMLSALAPDGQPQPSRKALTHETPTPCRPPDTLYEFWLNLPPACSTHITISALNVSVRACRRT
jgi:hypothetical protein